MSTADGDIPDRAPESDCASGTPRRLALRSRAIPQSGARGLQQSMAETDLRPANAIGDILASHVGQPGGLLPLLHDIQDALGYIPPAEVARIADALNLSRADVHGVISFYHYF